MKDKKSKVLSFIESLPPDEGLIGTTSAILSMDIRYQGGTTSNSGDCTNSSSDACNSSTNGGNCKNAMYYCNNSKNHGDCNNNMPHPQPNNIPENCGHP